MVVGFLLLSDSVVDGGLSDWSLTRLSLLLFYQDALDYE